jgi:hypothetical protein
MRKGKNPNMLVLALEIAAIVILHAIKINQTEKMVNNREQVRNASVAQTAQMSTPTSMQTDARIRASYSLGSFK